MAPTQAALLRPVPTGNPDPSRYDIVHHEIVNGYLLMWLQYPGCTNYEGEKILVFGRGVTYPDLTQQGAIDPHFGNDGLIYPIARFRPTSVGWDNALTFVRALA